MNREKTFKSVYGTEAPKAVLGLYIEDLKQVKRLSKTKQYQGLLELLLKYSYAIFYDYKTVSIINNRLKYRQEAMKILKNDDVEKAFNFIARATPLKPKREEPIEEKESSLIAIEEIKRLKAQLDTNSYKLSRGQKKEDKQIFIKVALVALSTGARLKEIMETLELSSKKGVISFQNGEHKEEGVVLELDIKTIRAYLKDIRSHYSDRIAKGTDISTGIRKAVKSLNIKAPASKAIKGSVSGNLNHLNDLYRESIA